MGSSQQYSTNLLTAENLNAELKNTTVIEP